MTTMVDKTGATVEVPEDQVSQAYSSGKYGIPQGQAVHGYDDNGDLQQLDPTKLDAYLSSGGRVASQEEVHAADLEKRHGGLGGSLAALGEGAARGISLGASDPLAIGAARLFGGDEAAEHTRTHLAEEKETHPWLATGGELLGAAAPVILSGGAAAPEAGAAIAGGEAVSLGSEAQQAASVFQRIGQGVRTLGLAPRGVSAAGDAFEHVVSGVIGSEAESALGKAGLAAAKGAARGIIEGGLFGGGEQISESSLENKPLTAEKILTSIGHGALMGGLLGGGLAGAGSLAGMAVKSVTQRLSPELDEQSAKQATKWLEPSKADSKLFDARHGGDVGIGEVVRDDILRPAVEAKGMAGAMMTPEEKLDATIAARQSAGQKIAAHLDANEGATVKLGEMFDPIDSRISEYSGKILGEDKVRALTDLKASIAKVFGVEGNLAEMAQQAKDAGLASGLKGEELGNFVKDHMAEQTQNLFDDMSDKAIPIKDAIEQRRALQQVVYQETKSLDPKLRVQLLRDVSGAWSDLEQKSLDEASAAEGGEAGKQLKALNDRYSKLKAIEGALENNRARYQTNRYFSLSDNMYGAAQMGGAIASGHPLGAIGSLAVAQGHKMIREHGNAYASILLDRLATWGGVSRAVAEHDEMVESSLASAINSKAAKPMGKPRLFAVKTGNDNARFDKEEKRIRAAAAIGTAAIGAHVAGQLTSVGTHSPDLAKAVQDKHMAATQFLQDKLPPSPASQGPALQPSLQKAHVSEPQKASFLRSVDAVNGGPPAILKRLAKGQMTSEDVEVLKKVYPESYGEIRTKAMAACGDRTKPIDYQTRLRFGRLLEFPADASMTPEFMQLTQKAWQSAPKAEEQDGGAGAKGHGSKGPAKLAIVGQSETATESAIKEGAAA